MREYTWHFSIYQSLNDPVESPWVYCLSCEEYTRVTKLLNHEQPNSFSTKRNGVFLSLRLPACHNPSPALLSFHIS